MKQSTATIWTIYIITFFYFAFFNRGWNRSDDLGIFILLGWIPFVVVHLLWSRVPYSPAVNINHGTSDTKTPAPNLERLRTIVGIESLAYFSKGADITDRFVAEAEQDLTAHFSATGHDLSWYESADTTHVVRPSDPSYVRFLQLQDRLTLARSWASYFAGFFKRLPDINKLALAGASDVVVLDRYNDAVAQLNSDHTSRLTDIAEIMAINEQIAAGKTWRRQIQIDKIHNRAIEIVKQGQLDLEGPVLTGQRPRTSSSKKHTAGTAKRAASRRTTPHPSATT